MITLYLCHSQVYTINNESQHIVIYRVPKINLSQELRALCMKYGEIKKFKLLLNYKTEIFTECYHVNFERIQSARIAKRFLDNKSFYGETLHVCYAPEFETLDETRLKLNQRDKDVLSRLEPGPTLLEYANVEVDNQHQQQNRKRKNPAIPITDKRLRTENADIWEGIPAEIDPRLQGTTSGSQIGFRKHFQIEIQKPRGVEYGPYMPSDPILQSYERNLKTTEVQTTLVPTTIIKKYDNTTNKKIVFRKNK